MEKEEMCYYVDGLVAKTDSDWTLLCHVLLPLDNVLGKTLNLEQTFKRLKLLIANKNPIRIRFLIEKTIKDTSS